MAKVSDWTLASRSGGLEDAVIFWPSALGIWPYGLSGVDTAGSKFEDPLGVVVETVIQLAPRIRS